MKKNIVLITIPILMVIAVLFAFGIKADRESYSNFPADGFIIDNTSKKESSKYYFNKNNKYKINDAKDQVIFDSSESVEIAIPKDTFLHYTDGSISTLKKAVVLNIDDLKNESFQYYSIFTGAIFTKTDSGYQINYLDSKLGFGNLIIKISDNKYLVAGSSMSIKYGTNEEKVEGFVEINYMDGNIVKIENQDINISNISSDLRIEIGKAKIDLDNKKIYYNDEFKVNLGEMTIDSDDNIEIIEDEVNTTIDEEAQKKIEEENEKAEQSQSYLDNVDNLNNIINANGSHGTATPEKEMEYTPMVNISGLKEGLIDTALKNVDEVVEENEKVPDAVFTVTSLDVTQNSISIALNVEDVGKTLTTDYTLKVVETATNQVVKTMNIPKKSGEINNIDDIDDLKPETNYIITIHAGYIKNEVKYEKDFLQRTIVTQGLGVTVAKKYVKTNEVAFDVTKLAGFDATSLEYAIYEENVATPVKTGNVEFYSKETEPGEKDNKINRTIVLSSSEYKNMKSNTKYKLVITKITYNASMFIDHNLNLVQTATTLKKTPIFTEGSVNHVDSKIASKFTIYLNNIKDEDNGIESYRVEVYDSDKDDAALITKKSATLSNRIEIDLDDKIERGNTYYARVYIVFNDNEIIHDIPVSRTPFSMLIDGFTPPVVEFEGNKAKIESETIDGNVRLTNTALTLSAAYPVVISYYGLTTNTPIQYIEYDLKAEEVASDTVNIKLSVDGLKSSEDYMFIVSGYLDFGLGDGPQPVSNIGSFITKTKESKPLKVNWDAVEGANKIEFNYNMYLSKIDGIEYNESINNIPYEMNILKSFELWLYAEDYDETKPCVEQNECWMTTYEKNEGDGNHTSSLANLIYSDGSKLAVYPNAQFGLEMSDGVLEYKTYCLELRNLKDYTVHGNEIRIEGDNQKECFLPNRPESGIFADPSFSVKEIKNNGTIKTNEENIDENTVIGYRITPAIPEPPTGLKLQLMIFDEVKHTSRMLDPTEYTYDGTTFVVLFENVKDNTIIFERGGIYRFAIHATYTKISNGETVIKKEDTTSNSASIKTHTPLKQTPSVAQYVSKKGNGELKINFKYTDVDDALTDKNIYYVTPSLIAKAASCGLEGCFSKPEFTATFTGFPESDSNQVNIYTNMKLTEDQNNTNYNVKGIVYGNLINPISYETTKKVDYELNVGISSVRVEFKNIESNLLNRLSQVQITFVDPVSKKEFTYNSNEILQRMSSEGTVNYIDVPLAVLSSVYDIGTEVNTSVKFVYKNGIIGYQNEETPYGFVAYNKDDRSTIEIQNESIFSVKENKSLFSTYKIGNSYYYGGITLVGKESGNEYKLGAEYQGSAPGPVLTYGKTYNLGLEQLSAVDGQCPGCKVTVTNARPTVSMNKKSVNGIINGANLNGTILDNGNKDITAYALFFFPMDPTAGDEEHCCGHWKNLNSEDNKNVYRKIQKLDDNNIKNIDIKGLGLNTTYCMKVLYTQGDSEPTISNLNDFFYSEEEEDNLETNDIDEARKYIFTTEHDMGIYDIKVDYYNREHSSKDRTLKLTYKFLEKKGVDGIEYALRDTEGTNEYIDIKLDDEDLEPITNYNVEKDIKIQPTPGSPTNILANHSYNIDVKPYYYACEDDYVQEDRNGNVAGADENGCRKVYLWSGETITNDGYSKNFRYSITFTDPTFQRIPNSEAYVDNTGIFSYSITINDVRRALGTYKPNDETGELDREIRVSGYIYDENKDRFPQPIYDPENPENDYFTLNRVQKTIFLQDIDHCEGSKFCYIYLDFTIDLDNDGIFEDYRYEHRVALNKADIGDYTMNFLNNYDGLKILYTNYFNFDDIIYIDYTVMKRDEATNSTEVLFSEMDHEIEHGTDGNTETSIKVVNIPFQEALANGIYVIQLTYKDEAGKQIVSTTDTMIIDR